MTSTITFHVGDVRDVLAAMPDSSVDLLVTSPPFLALRSYLPDDHPDKHREIGSEPTPAAFLDTMLALTADWRRVVADWGSIAVEIGDTYSGSGGAGGDYGDGGMRANQPKFRQGYVRNDRPNRPPQTAGKLANFNDDRGNPDGMRDTTFSGANTRTGGGPGWPMAKSLCGIPTLYTWSLAYGRNLLTGEPSPAGQWRIRNLLTWTRPNPPVGALGDKFRPATSFVTVACVDDKRWFDLDAVRTASVNPLGVGVRPTMGRVNGADDRDQRATLGPFTRDMQAAGAPPLDWWDANDWQPLHRLPTQPYKGSHYAAFPVALPARLIEAMCPREVCGVCGEPRRRIVETTNAIQLEHERHHRDERRENSTSVNSWKRLTGAVSSDVRTLGWTDCSCVPMFTPQYRPGIVLDPFGGSGTTALAAAQAGRDAVLIDIDRRNVDLARHRIADAMQIVHEQIDGDTWTWTVDPGLPGLKGEHPDQLSLLGDIT